MSSPFHPADSAEQAFRSYIQDLTSEVTDMVIPKARTYGTTELSQLGATLMNVAGKGTVPERGSMQYAVWFYSIGKMARWTAAVKRGEQPTRDTVLDILVYALMWLKVEETGEWWVDMPSQETSSPSWLHRKGRAEPQIISVNTDGAEKAKAPSAYQAGDRIPTEGVRSTLTNLPVYSVVAPDRDLFDLVWIKTGHNTWYRTGLTGPLFTGEVAESVTDCDIRILYVP